MSPKTLYDKIWDAHVVHEADDGTCLLYIDRHLVHEVTSPQAFEGLRMAGRKVRAPEKTIAVPDHNVPTTPDRVNGIENPESRIQVEALDKNAYALTGEDRLDIPSTPDRLNDALEALKKDHAFLMEGGVFSEDLIRTWIDYKFKNEIQDLYLRPHPHEFHLYYDS